MQNILLKVEELKKYFPVKKGIFAKPSYVKAVDDINFHVNKSETLGLVGESGSGKTTVGLLVLRLIDPTSGRIFFDGIDITAISQKLMKFRKRMSIVFQDPLSSLNPRMTVKETLKRPLVTHGLKNEGENIARIMETLEMVGLGKEHMERYPHELSGGQQQRVAVARAIILNPELLVLDEPTSSLDVSVQAQILNLLLKLQRELNLTYLFISHDLVTVRHVSDRVAVMYLGKIVEVAETDELFRNTMHPYTAALLSAAPIPKPEAKDVERFVVSGEPPSPINPPFGCRFHPRCKYATEKCVNEEPQLIGVGKNHIVACHRAKEIDISSYAKKLWEILMAKT
ncbi:MAG: ABC transporter ATP-binding protein [Candidatus Bathyarchaeia archaeon]